MSGSARAQRPDPRRKRESDRRESDDATAMPAADIPADVATKARELAEVLVQLPEEYVSLADVTRQAEEDHELAFLDVQSNLEHYRRQEEILREVGRGIPCVETPNDVPLPVSLFPTNYPVGDDDRLRELVARTDYSADLPEKCSNDVGEHEHEEARGFLRERLSSFLAFRLFGLKLRRYEGEASSEPPSSSRSPGLPFTVETANRFGLSILCSTAYFRVPQQFGTTLSTPVTGWLLPGRWIFGTRSSDGHTTWVDDVVYDVPGQTNVAQL